MKTIKKQIDYYLSLDVDISLLTGDSIIDELCNHDKDGNCTAIEISSYIDLEEELGGKEEVAKLLQYADKQGYEFLYKGQLI